MAICRTQIYPATVSQKGDTFKTNARQHIHQVDKGALKRVLVTKEVFNEKSLIFCVFFGVGHAYPSKH
jgi:hypothetical protein